MSDRYYSLQAEDSNGFFMNYNGMPPLAQAPAGSGFYQGQPLVSLNQQQLGGFSGSGVADYDILNLGAGGPSCYYSGSGGSNNQSYNAYMSGAGGAAGMPSKRTHFYASFPSYTAAGVGEGPRHYSQPGGDSSYYYRNRYVPYSHNRACAAAAGNTLNPQSFMGTTTTTTTAMSTPPLSSNVTAYFASSLYQNRLQHQQQQYTPIYQTCPMPPPPPLTTSTLATISSAVSAATVTPPSTVHSSALDRSMNISLNASLTDPTTTIASSAALSDNGSGVMMAASTAPVNGPSTSLLTTQASLSTSANGMGITSTPYNGVAGTTANAYPYSAAYEPSQTVTLQITNLDYSMDEPSLRNFLMNQLKPFTPVLSLIFEGNSYAKVTVPDLYFAKQVVSNLHRKKIGHKRMMVSYTRDSSLTEVNTLRCQVAGLLKDVPYYTLPMYKFRELFQSRFKTSINVLDLYKMQDICSINVDANEEKFITLQPDLVNSLENSPLMEGLQHSVPYCTTHFKREQHKGWAEQDIEPLPNVFMTISELQRIIQPLMKNHPGDIPVATLIHCIESELDVQITPNDMGVNLEHLVSCVQGVQIQVNNFGIKILSWQDPEHEYAPGNQNLIERATGCGGGLGKGSMAVDPLYQISREVVELVKMSPKATMKFNRFIPAYHNHFGKQCRVADYGYTKLIELFEALSAVVQIMGDGENRQITLTHRTQIRRFTSDLLRVLRTQSNKPVLLSQLPAIFSQTQNRHFDITDYGVCDITDILDGLVHSNIVVVTTVDKGKDILISVPKRKRTAAEIEKTCVFAGEMVELFRNAPQYSICFHKFVRSYHYHFGYQCRLSDYGFLKLADLMEAISGVVEIESTSDEDNKKLYLSPTIARRVFAEQCEELIEMSNTGGTAKCRSMELEEVLKLHKKKFGYQIMPQTLGFEQLQDAIEMLPYVEVVTKEDSIWLSCHIDDMVFRRDCFRACKLLLAYEIKHSTSSHSNKSVALRDRRQVGNSDGGAMPLTELIRSFHDKHKKQLNESTVKAMKHAIEIFPEEEVVYARLSKFMKFLMNIVRLLEQRSNLQVNDIKFALDCGINTTFEFGYPNLYAVINAHPDLFVLNVGASQERSEVSLVQPCELRIASYGNHPHVLGTFKLPYAKPKPGPRLYQRPQPLADHANRANISASQPLSNANKPGFGNPFSNNNDASGGLSALANAYRNTVNAGNTQATKQQQAPIPYAPASQNRPYFNNNNNNNNNNSNYNYSNINPYSSITHTQANINAPASCATVFCQTSNSNSNPNNKNSSNNSSLNSSSAYHSNSLNLSSSNKENSFSNSFGNMFNSSFNSSSLNNNSLGEMNCSMSAVGNSSPQQSALTQPLASSTAATASMLYGGGSNKPSTPWSLAQMDNFYQQQRQHIDGFLAAAGCQWMEATNNAMANFSMPQQQPMAQGQIPKVSDPVQPNGLYDMISSMQRSAPHTDTAPSAEEGRCGYGYGAFKNSYCALQDVPFWRDPIWTNSNSTDSSYHDMMNLGEESSTGNMAEVKSTNDLPVILSPYTVSKKENTKRQQFFNFDNDDRKVA